MSESNKRSIVWRSESVGAGPSLCSEDAAKEQDGHPVTSRASHWLSPVGKNKHIYIIAMADLWSLKHPVGNRCLV